jgi:hypothetical protein
VIPLFVLIAAERLDIGAPWIWKKLIIAGNEGNWKKIAIQVVLLDLRLEAFIA